MEICFLGTASCLPSLTRGVSSVALRLMGRRGAGSSTWIFDAGTRVYACVCVCVCVCVWVCVRARARVRVYKEHGSSTWIFDAGTRPLNKCVLKWALICALIRALTCALNVYLNVCRGGYVDTEAKELVS